jgi:predicted dehydrogenase
MAASAGKHIVLERPMAITAEQLDAVEQAVEQSGVKLAVISQLRFMASVQRLKTAIENGELGKIYFADCRMRYYRSQEYYDQGGWRGTWALDGGGALMNQGIHGIDLVQYIMGGVESVYAQCRTLGRNIETEDAANLLVEYKCGAMGVIQGTTLANPGEPRTITISSEKGTVVLQEDTIVRWDVEGQSVTTGQTEVGSHQDPMAFSFAFHQTQLEDLLDAIRQDRRPFVDEKEGRKGVEIILAAYRSEQTGQKQYLKD